MKKKQFALLGINCWVNYMKQIIENKNKKTEEAVLMSSLETRINYWPSGFRYNVAFKR